MALNLAFSKKSSPGPGARRPLTKLVKSVFKIERISDFTLCFRLKVDLETLDLFRTSSPIKITFLLFLTIFLLFDKVIYIRL